MFVLFIIFLAIAASVMNEDEGSSEILAVAVDVQVQPKMRP
jgi:hypothetical protein